MKKTLLALGSAFMALTGMAAAPNLQPASSPLKFDANQAVTSQSSRNVTLPRPADKGMMKTPAKVGSPEDIITEAKGRKQNITIIASGFFMYYGMSYQGYRDQHVATHMVYGSDKEVYIYDIIPLAAYEGVPYNSYVKGRQEGDKIIIDLPQTVYWNEEEWGEGVNVSMLKWGPVEYDGEIVDYWLYDDEADSITFTIGEDGIMRADLGPDQMLGLTYTTDNWYADYGAYEMTMEEFNETMTTLPGGYGVVDDWYWYNTGVYGYTVGWAPGDDMWLRGLCEALPDSWIKCTPSPEDPFTYRIAQDQYIGISNGYYMWTKAARFDLDDNGDPIAAYLMPEDYQYEIYWDPATDTYLPKDKDVYLIINAAKDRVWYLDCFWNFNVGHPADWSGTPADPYNLIYFHMRFAAGYDGLQCIVPQVSTEGNLLDPNDLYYEICLDDEVWTFDPDEYGVESPIELIPWTLNVSHIEIPIEIGLRAMRMVDIFVEGFQTISIQSIYKHNGVETRSKRMVVEVKDPNSVTVVDTDKKVTDVKYFDLSGREVAKPAAGIFVKKVTYEDGTVNTSKTAVR